MNSIATYKNPITIRGDSVYCPLCLCVDSYWGCEPDCLHCFLRALNHTWGKDFRVAEPSAVENQLRAGLRNRNPKTPLAWALSQKKTIRLGNKSDPFQPIEDDLQVSSRIVEILISMEWSFVVQTRFATRAWKTLRKFANHNRADRPIVHFMPIVSPGLDKDWELFERMKTDPPEHRVKSAALATKKGIPSTVQGEPFIPGFHTPDDFRQALKLLKSYGIMSYSTYNFHFTPFVAKRIVQIKEVDIERIWYYNRDDQWRIILKKLLQIADEEGVKVGCPDFVNSGRRIEPFNTCCGIDVPNPATFNSHHFKRLWLEGKSAQEILESCWDGTGSWEVGKQIVMGTTKKFYTLKDIR